LIELQVEDYGGYVADPSSKTLYTYKPDAASNSTCYGTCASLWPPYIVASADGLTVGSDLNSSLIGTFMRTDSKLIVTYNKWPLYYYSGDSAAD